MSTATSLFRAASVVVLALTALITAATLVRPAKAQTSDATSFYTPASFSTASGEEVYRTVCQSCHMPAGEGALGGGEYPALAGNPKLAAAPFVAMMVLDGRAGMPGLGQMLSDQQVAEVTHYVRTHFGNDYPEAMTANDVKAMRH
jgi:mono/diheme cytochrome c family protein